MYKLLLSVKDIYTQQIFNTKFYGCIEKKRIKLPTEIHFLSLCLSVSRRTRYMSALKRHFKLTILIKLYLFWNCLYQVFNILKSRRFRIAKNDFLMHSICRVSILWRNRFAMQHRVAAKLPHASCMRLAECKWNARKSILLHYEPRTLIFWKLDR